MKDENFCRYLEKLRYARKLTLKDFVEYGDIISDRQYKRYRAGKSDMPIHVIDKLAKKLGMSITMLLSNYLAEEQEETRRINALYNQVVNKSYKHLEAEIKRFNTHEFLDIENKMYFKHVEMLYRFDTKMINSLQYTDMTIRLINYPSILENEFLNKIEILVLSSLLDHKNHIDSEKIYKKLSTYLEEKNPSFFAVKNDYILPLILVRLSKFQGIRKNHKLVIKWCNLGIKRAKEIKSDYLKEYFYYYLSLAYYKEKDFELHEKSLNQLLGVLFIEGNKDKEEKFLELINKDFEKDYESIELSFIPKSKV